VKAAVLSVVLAAAWPQTAVANEGSATTCELVLAIWTQFWNEAPRQSFLIKPGAAEPMDCAWNAGANTRAPGSFSASSFSDGGNAASMQMNRNYGGHSDMYHCSLARDGDYWRVSECEAIGIADAAF
jgi:hypothetical protein